MSVQTSRAQAGLQLQTLVAMGLKRPRAAHRVYSGVGHTGCAAICPGMSPSAWVAASAPVCALHRAAQSLPPGSLTRSTSSARCRRLRAVRAATARDPCSWPRIPPTSTGAISDSLAKLRFWHCGSLLLVSWILPVEACVDDPRDPLLLRPGQGAPASIQSLPAHLGP